MLIGMDERALPDAATGLAWRPDDRAIAAFDASGGVTVGEVSKP